MRAAALAIGLLAMSACASDPHHDLAQPHVNKPPVYGERPGETQELADALIFGPSSFTSQGIEIK